MNILFVASQLYFPQLYGGVQTSTDQLCRALMARGHRVSVLASLMPGGWFGMKSRLNMHFHKYTNGIKASRDTHCGYPVWRTWFPTEAIADVAHHEDADLIVILSGKMVPLVQAAKKTGLPLLAQLHDIAFHAQEGNVNELIGIPCVANSQFTADSYRTAYGLDSTVIYPFIEADKYRTETSRQNITFINPHPRKGLDLAVAIARLCPDIPFTFVEGWTLSPEQRSNLHDKIASLSNVTLIPSVDDMRTIYSVCKILLMPSLCEESYGRVATEAQLSGIPVIASNRGALPEVVSNGGILLDPEAPIEAWIDAVRILWHDNHKYAELSQAALQHAKRPVLDFALQIDAHEEALINAVHKTHKAAA